MKLTELKTFEDACRVESIDPDTAISNVFTTMDTPLKAPLIALLKLLIIAAAANRLANDGKAWVPDWSDYDQIKYTPWFDMAGSSGFQFYDCDLWGSASDVSSRLCFISSETGEYVAKTFIKLYKEYFTM